jgi:hypothetical protein
MMCGDVIESMHARDWVKCSCGGVFIDGGHEVLRMGTNDPSQVELLHRFTKDHSEADEVKTGDEWTTSEVGL